MSTYYVNSIPSMKLPCKFTTEQRLRHLKRGARLSGRSGILSLRLCLGFLVCSLFATSSAIGQKIPRDGNDPPPDLTLPGNHPSTNSQNPQRAETGVLLLTRKLSGYPVGSPVHSGSFRFADQIVSELRDFARISQRPLRVIVTGTADGIPNDGVNYPIQRLPVECQSAVTVPINDPSLALLRACVLRLVLLDLLRSSPVDVIWERRVVDEPDGVNTGDPYRYVQVEIFR